MSSRMIEEATYTDIAARYSCGNTAHPDHTVICRFRTENREAFKEAFTKVVVMAQELGHMKKMGNISVDGTKIHANVSKHSAVSYRRAKAMIEEAEKEVEELLAKAEDADSRPLEDGLRIPEEIALREERKAALMKAKAAVDVASMLIVGEYVTNHGNDKQELKARAGSVEPYIRQKR
jgi:hypothetical protein